MERATRKRADQLATLTMLLNDLDPTVPSEQVEELIDQVAPAAFARTAMATHVTAHPDVLTAGGSGMPKVVAEFIYAAIDVGMGGLVPPGCALCDRPRTLFHTHGDQRICTTRYSRLRATICSRCGRDGQRIRSHTSDGEPLCPRCHDQDRQPEACAGCGRSRLLKRSAIDGLGYCRACRARRAPTTPCSVCGQDRRINARTPNGDAVCTTCYAKTRTGTHPCDECGQVVPLNARADGRSDTARNLCARCYRHPKRECGICGRTRRVALRATDTSPDICPTCYQAPFIDCTVCGQHALGRRATRNGRPWCFACQATDRIDQLLGGPDGAVPEGIRNVRDALVVTPRPRSILSNWHNIESLSLLAKLARQHDELSHELLDAEGDRFSVGYLRALLVAGGALPERDENTTRLGRFTGRVIDEVSDARYRQVLTLYARWHVVARAKLDRHGQLSAASADRCRQEIRSAQRFLDHLETRGRTVDDCTQADLDSWLANRHGIQIRFPRWLLDNGHLTGIVLPDPVPISGPRRHVDQDEHWALVRRMLHDEDAASTEDRAAACLVLLYAQPISKIVALTTNEIDVTDDGTYLRLGPEPLLLLPPLDVLVTSLPIAKPFGAASTLADDRWLFPGKCAGHHQHPTSLMSRLNRIGITTRASRNTAMLHLAATVPPAVFASLIGISIGSAVRWAEYAGSNWTTYAAIRTRATASPRQNQ
jgi:formylmethanofuran dehydrogenase subunit E